MFFKRSFQRNKAVAGFAQTKADKLGELFHEEGNKAYRNVVHKYSDERCDRAYGDTESYLIKSHGNYAGYDLVSAVYYADERHRTAYADNGYQRGDKAYRSCRKQEYQPQEHRYCGDAQHCSERYRGAEQHAGEGLVALI